MFILSFMISLTYAAVWVAVSFGLIFITMMQFAQISEEMIELIETINNVPGNLSLNEFTTLLEVQQKVASGCQGVTFFNTLFTRAMVVENMWKLLLLIPTWYGVSSKILT